jgi:hypothetical protein
VIHHGSSGDIGYKKRQRLCPKCLRPFESDTSPISSCSACWNYAPKQDRRIVGWLVKTGFILATIVLDIVLLLGSGYLGAAAITANNLALAILAIPAVIGMFGYVIGGNKVTYRFLKSLSRYAQAPKDC